LTIEALIAMVLEKPVVWAWTGEINRKNRAIRMMNIDMNCIILLNTVLADHPADGRGPKEAEELIERDGREWMGSKPILIKY